MKYVQGRTCDEAPILAIHECAVPPMQFANALHKYISGNDHHAIPIGMHINFMM